MATIQGLTKDRMLAIEAASIVDGEVDATKHLILTKHDGTTIDAGLVQAEGVPTGGSVGQILAKNSSIDNDTVWIDNYSTQTKHEVKLGDNITKGQAVYVSSANGTNMIVSKASNSSEATSSKTMGLIETTGVTNDFVKVVTEGLLTNIDTNSATVGDPVWLGTSGNLLYGLANKPKAPAHLVYIGVVTRKSANVGEIFVHVQNGFELDELHDVKIESPSTGQVLQRTASNLWENKSLSDAGISEVEHTHTIANVTDLQSTLDSKVDESYQQVTSGWLTASSGWGSINGIYTEKNGIVIVNLTATRTGAAISAGNITNTSVMVISSGYRPLVEAPGISGPSGPLASFYISATGTVTMSALGTTISTGDIIDINATYIKA